MPAQASARGAPSVPGAGRPAAPHRRDATPHLPASDLRPADVVALQSVRDYPCVSVLMTTTPAVRMSAADAARLNRMIARTEPRLLVELPQERVTTVMDRIRLLAVEAAEQPTSAAVALYATETISARHRLPMAVDDRVVVDPTFATRDLVRALHRTPRHLVLVLTDTGARLYQGVDTTLRPETGGGFPLLREAEPDDRATTGGRNGKGRTNEQRLAFLRMVDRALGTHLRLHPYPVVVVGVEKQLAAFGKVTRYAGNVAGVVRGSHGRTPPTALVALVRPVLEDHLRARERQALELLERRADAHRAVEGMQAVWLASRVERPEMLVVEETLYFPARLSSDGDYLIPASDVEHPEVIDDAVDEVIEFVLLRGGWVALVRDGALAHRDRIALTLRR